MPRDMTIAERPALHVGDAGLLGLQAPLLHEGQITTGPIGVDPVVLLDAARVDLGLAIVIGAGAGRGGDDRRGGDEGEDFHGTFSWDRCRWCSISLAFCRPR